MRSSIWLKFTAGILVFLFVVNDLGQAAPALDLSASFRTEIPRVSHISIPPEMATLEDWYESSSVGDTRLMLHIQDAHAQPEAQARTRDLLHYLNKQYGFKTVFVEGAAEQLDVKWLHPFKNPEQNKKWIEEKTASGEMSGVDLALLDGMSGLKALPIETIEGYRNGYQKLRAVYSAEPEVKSFFDFFDTKLDLAASKILNEKTRAILSEWKKFESGHREFLPFVEKLASLAKADLALDLNALYSQIEWPQATRLLVLQKAEKEIGDRQSGIKEKQVLIDLLKSKQVSAGIIQGLERLDEKNLNLNRITVGDGRQFSSPRALVEQLIEETRRLKIDLRDYPAFLRYAGYIILRGELQPALLFKEIEKLFNQLLDSSMASGLVKDENIELIGIYRDSFLLKKLLNLELSREEWKSSLAKRSELEPLRMAERLKSLGKNQPVSETPAGNLAQKSLKAVFDNAFDFYDASLAREEIFFNRISNALAKNDKAIVITGGFHTGGMNEFFREKNISYGTLTPRMTNLAPTSLYRSAMMRSPSSETSSHALIPKSHPIKSARLMIMPAVSRPEARSELRGVPAGSIWNSLFQNDDNLRTWLNEEVVLAAKEKGIIPRKSFLSEPPSEDKLAKLTDALIESRFFTRPLAMSVEDKRLLSNEISVIRQQVDTNGVADPKDDWYFAEFILRTVQQKIIKIKFEKVIAASKVEGAEKEASDQFDRWLNSAQMNLKSVTDRMKRGELLDNVVFVVSHAKPDYDAVVSALAEAYQQHLKHEGKKLVFPLLMQGLPDPLHPAYDTLDKLGINPALIPTWSQMMKDEGLRKAFEKMAGVPKEQPVPVEFYLVDHADDIVPAEFPMINKLTTAILDHHKQPDYIVKDRKKIEADPEINSPERVLARRNEAVPRLDEKNRMARTMGSTATLIAEHFRYTHRHAPKKLLMFLLMSLVIDSENMHSNSFQNEKKNAKDPLDTQIFKHLSSRLGDVFQSEYDVRRFLNAYLVQTVLNGQGLSSFDVFKRDVKWKEVRYHDELRQFSFGSTDRLMEDEVALLWPDIRREILNFLPDDSEIKDPQKAKPLAVIHRFSVWGEGRTWFAVHGRDGIRSGDLAEYLAANAPEFQTEGVTVEKDAESDIYLIKVPGIIQRKEIHELVTAYLNSRSEMRTVDFSEAIAHDLNTQIVNHLANALVTELARDEEELEIGLSVKNPTHFKVILDMGLRNRWAKPDSQNVVRIDVDESGENPSLQIVLKVGSPIQIFLMNQSGIETDITKYRSFKAAKRDAINGKLNQLEKLVPNGGAFIKDESFHLTTEQGKTQFLSSLRKDLKSDAQYQAAKMRVLSHKVIKDRETSTPISPAAATVASTVNTYQAAQKIVDEFLKAGEVAAAEIRALKSDPVVTQDVNVTKLSEVKNALAALEAKQKLIREKINALEKLRQASDEAILALAKFSQKNQKRNELTDIQADVILAQTEVHALIQKRFEPLAGRILGMVEAEYKLYSDEDIAKLSTWEGAPVNFNFDLPADREIANQTVAGYRAVMKRQTDVLAGLDAAFKYYIGWIAAFEMNTEVRQALERKKAGRTTEVNQRFKNIRDAYEASTAALEAQIESNDRAAREATAARQAELEQQEHATALQEQQAAAAKAAKKERIIWWLTRGGIPVLIIYVLVVFVLLPWMGRDSKQAAPRNAQNEATAAQAAQRDERIQLFQARIQALPPDHQQIASDLLTAAAQIKDPNDRNLAFQFVDFFIDRGVVPDAESARLLALVKEQRGQGLNLLYADIVTGQMIYFTRDFVFPTPYLQALLIRLGSQVNELTRFQAGDRNWAATVRVLERFQNYDYSKPLPGLSQQERDDVLYFARRWVDIRVTALEREVRFLTSQGISNLPQAYSQVGQQTVREAAGNIQGAAFDLEKNTRQMFFLQYLRRLAVTTTGAENRFDAERARRAILEELMINLGDEKGLVRAQPIQAKAPSAMPAEIKTLFELWLAIASIDSPNVIGWRQDLGSMHIDDINQFHALFFGSTNFSSAGLEPPASSPLKDMAVSSQPGLAAGPVLKQLNFNQQYEFHPETSAMDRIGDNPFGLSPGAIDEIVVASKQKSPNAQTDDWTLQGLQSIRFVGQNIDDKRVLIGVAYFPSTTVILGRWIAAGPQTIQPLNALMTMPGQGAAVITKDGIQFPAAPGSGNKGIFVDLESLLQRMPPREKVSSQDGQSLPPGISKAMEEHRREFIKFAADFMSQFNESRLKHYGPLTRKISDQLHSEKASWNAVLLLQMLREMHHVFEEDLGYPDNSGEDYDRIKKIIAEAEQRLSGMSEADAANTLSFYEAQQVAARTQLIEALQKLQPLAEKFAASEKNPGGIDPEVEEGFIKGLGSLFEIYSMNYGPSRWGPFLDLDGTFTNHSWLIQKVREALDNQSLGKNMWKTAREISNGNFRGIKFPVKKEPIKKSAYVSPKDYIAPEGVSPRLAQIIADGFDFQPAMIGDFYNPRSELRFTAETIGLVLGFFTGTAITTFTAFIGVPFFVAFMSGAGVFGLLFLGFRRLWRLIDPDRSKPGSGVDLADQEPRFIEGGHEKSVREKLVQVSRIVRKTLSNYFSSLLPALRFEFVGTRALSANELEREFEFLKSKGLIRPEIGAYFRGNELSGLTDFILWNDPATYRYSEGAEAITKLFADGENIYIELFDRNGKIPRHRYEVIPQSDFESATEFSASEYVKNYHDVAVLHRPVWMNFSDLKNQYSSRVDDWGFTFNVLSFWPIVIAAVYANENHLWQKPAAWLKATISQLSGYADFVHFMEKGSIFSLVTGAALIVVSLVGVLFGLGFVYAAYKLIRNGVIYSVFLFYYLVLKNLTHAILLSDFLYWKRSADSPIEEQPRFLDALHELAGEPDDSDADDLDEEAADDAAERFTFGIDSDRRVQRIIKRISLTSLRQEMLLAVGELRANQDEPSDSATEDILYIGNDPLLAFKLADLNPDNLTVVSPDDAYLAMIESVLTHSREEHGLWGRTTDKTSIQHSDLDAFVADHEAEQSKPFDLIVIDPMWSLAKDVLIPMVDHGQRMVVLGHRSSFAVGNVQRSINDALPATGTGGVPYFATGELSNDVAWEKLRFGLRMLISTPRAESRAITRRSFMNTSSMAAAFSLMQRALKAAEQTAEVIPALVRYFGAKPAQIVDGIRKLYAARLEGNKWLSDEAKKIASKVESENKTIAEAALFQRRSTELLEQLAFIFSNKSPTFVQQVHDAGLILGVQENLFFKRMIQRGPHGPVNVANGTGVETGPLSSHRAQDDMDWLTGIAWKNHLEPNGEMNAVYNRFRDLLAYKFGFKNSVELDEFMGRMKSASRDVASQILGDGDKDEALSKLKQWRLKSFINQEQASALDLAADRFKEAKEKGADKARENLIVKVAAVIRDDMLGAVIGERILNDSEMDTLFVVIQLVRQGFLYAHERWIGEGASKTTPFISDDVFARFMDSRYSQTEMDIAHIYSHDYRRSNLPRSLRVSSKGAAANEQYWMNSVDAIAVKDPKRKKDVQERSIKTWNYNKTVMAAAASYLAKKYPGLLFNDVAEGGFLTLSEDKVMPQIASLARRISHEPVVIAAIPVSVPETENFNEVKETPSELAVNTTDEQQALLDERYSAFNELVSPKLLLTPGLIMGGIAALLVFYLNTPSSIGNALGLRSRRERFYRTFSLSFMSVSIGLLVTVVAAVFLGKYAGLTWAQVLTKKLIIPSLTGVIVSLLGWLHLKYVRPPTGNGKPSAAARPELRSDRSEVRREEIQNALTALQGISLDGLKGTELGEKIKDKLLGERKKWTVETNASVPAVMTFDDILNTLRAGTPIIDPALLSETGTRTQFGEVDLWRLNHPEQYDQYGVFASVYMAQDLQIAEWLGLIRMGPRPGDYISSKGARSIVSRFISLAGQPARGLPVGDHREISVAWPLVVLARAKLTTINKAEFQGQAGQLKFYREVMGLPAETDLRKMHKSTDDLIEGLNWQPIEINLGAALEVRKAFERDFASQNNPEKAYFTRLYRGYAGGERWLSAQKIGGITLQGKRRVSGGFARSLKVIADLIPEELEWYPGNARPYRYGEKEKAFNRALQNYIDYLQQTEQVPSKELDQMKAVILLGNPNGSIFLDFVNWWRRQKVKLPVVIVGGVGRGSVDLVDSILRLPGMESFSSQFAYFRQKAIEFNIATDPAAKDAIVADLRTAKATGTIASEAQVIQVFLLAQKLPQGMQDMIHVEQAGFSRTTPENFASAEEEVSQFGLKGKQKVFVFSDYPLGLRLRVYAINNWMGKVSEESKDWIPYALGIGKRKVFSLGLESLLSLSGYLGGFPKEFSTLNQGSEVNGIRNELTKALARGDERLKLMQKMPKIGAEEYQGEILLNRMLAARDELLDEVRKTYDITVDGAGLKLIRRSESRRKSVNDESAYFSKAANINMIQRVVVFDNEDIKSHSAFHVWTLLPYRLKRLFPKMTRIDLVGPFLGIFNYRSVGFREVPPDTRAEDAVVGKLHARVTYPKTLDAAQDYDPQTTLFIGHRENFVHIPHALVLDVMSPEFGLYRNGDALARRVPSKKHHAQSIAEFLGSIGLDVREGPTYLEPGHLSSEVDDERKRIWPQLSRTGQDMFDENDPLIIFNPWTPGQSQQFQIQSLEDQLAAARELLERHEDYFVLFNPGPVKWPSREMDNLRREKFDPALRKLKAQYPDKLLVLNHDENKPDKELQRIFAMLTLSTRTAVVSESSVVAHFADWLHLATFVRKKVSAGEVEEFLPPNAENRTHRWSKAEGLIRLIHTVLPSKKWKTEMALEPAKSQSDTAGVDDDFDGDAGFDFAANRSEMRAWSGVKPVEIRALIEKISKLPKSRMVVTEKDGASQTVWLKDATIVALQVLAEAGWAIVFPGSVFGLNKQQNKEQKSILSVIKTGNQFEFKYETLKEKVTAHFPENPVTELDYDPESGKLTLTFSSEFITQQRRLFEGMAHNKGRIEIQLPVVMKLPDVWLWKLSSASVWFYMTNLFFHAMAAARQKFGVSQKMDALINIWYAYIPGLLNAYFNSFAHSILILTGVHLFLVRTQKIFSFTFSDVIKYSAIMTTYHLTLENWQAQTRGSDFDWPDAVSGAVGAAFFSTLIYRKVRTAIGRSEMRGYLMPLLELFGVEEEKFRKIKANGFHLIDFKVRQNKELFQEAFFPITDKSITRILFYNGKPLSLIGFPFRDGLLKVSFLPGDYTEDEFFNLENDINNFLRTKFANNREVRGLLYESKSILQFRDPLDVSRLITVLPTVYPPDRATSILGRTMLKDIKPGEKVLVIGPGSGVDLVDLYHAGVRNLKAVGISPLEVINSNETVAQALGDDTGIQVAVGDLFNSPIISKDETFDRIVFVSPLDEAGDEGAASLGRMQTLAEVDPGRKLIQRLLAEASDRLSQNGVLTVLYKDDAIWRESIRESGLEIGSVVDGEELVVRISDIAFGAKIQQALAAAPDGLGSIKAFHLRRADAEAMRVVSAENVFKPENFKKFDGALMTETVVDEESGGAIYFEGGIIQGHGFVVENGKAVFHADSKSRVIAIFYRYDGKKFWKESWKENDFAGTQLVQIDSAGNEVGSPFISFDPKFESLKSLPTFLNFDPSSRRFFESRTAALTKARSEMHDLTLLSEMLNTRAAEFEAQIGVAIPGYKPQRSFNKAIRDNILDMIIKNDDEVPVWMILSPAAWEKFLALKLFEEFTEYLQTAVETGSAKEKTLIEEVSDMFEILDGLNHTSPWVDGSFVDYLRGIKTAIDGEDFPRDEESLTQTVAGNIIELSKLSGDERNAAALVLIKNLIRLAEVNQVDFETILSEKQRKQKKAGGFERRLFYVGKFLDEEGLEQFNSIGEMTGTNQFARHGQVRIGDQAVSVIVYAGLRAPDNTADANFNMTDYLQNYLRRRIERMLPDIVKGDDEALFFGALDTDTDNVLLGTIAELVRVQSGKSPVRLSSGEVGTQEIVLDIQGIDPSFTGREKTILLLQQLFRAHTGVTRDFVVKDIFGKADIVSQVIHARSEMRKAEPVAEIRQPKVLRPVAVFDNRRLMTFDAAEKLIARINELGVNEAVTVIARGLANPGWAPEKQLAVFVALSGLIGLEGIERIQQEMREKHPAAWKNLQDWIGTQGKQRNIFRLISVKQFSNDGERNSMLTGMKAVWLVNPEQPFHILVKGKVDEQLRRSITEELKAWAKRMKIENLAFVIQELDSSRLAKLVGNDAVVSASEAELLNDRFAMPVHEQFTQSNQEYTEAAMVALANLAKGSLVGRVPDGFEQNLRGLSLTNRSLGRFVETILRDIQSLLETAQSA